MSEITSPYRKMDPEQKRIWVEALRSGTFTQAKYILYNSNTGGFCCLGVNLKAVHGAQESVRGGGCFPGIEDWPATIGIDGCARVVLVRMNDGGATFPEIALWIEKHL